MNSAFLQTKVISWASDYVDKHYGVTLKVDRFYLIFPHAVSMQNLLVLDTEADTLISASQARIDVFDFSTDNIAFEISQLRLVDPLVKLKQVNDSTWNYQIYQSTEQGRTDSSSTPFQIAIDRIQILNGRFYYQSLVKDIVHTQGINYNDIGIEAIHLQASNLRLTNDSLSGSIQRFNLVEQSGFMLRQLSADFLFDNHQIALNQLMLKTNGSELFGGLSFHYDELSNFNAFTEQVHLKASLNESKLNLADLGYFSPPLLDKSLTVMIDGQFRGPIADLKGRKIDVRTPDQETHLRGNIDLIGLPNINRTFMSLRLSSFSSHMRSLRQIIQDLKLNKQVSIPENIGTFERFNYTGNFDGFFSDFVTYGRLSTAIGQVNFDLSLKQPDNQNEHYAYMGKINAREFHLGKFYQKKELGLLSGKLAVDGTGLKLNTMDANVSGEIEHIQFRGYDYKNIGIEGLMTKYLFLGKAGIKDPNLVLDFEGGIDFSDQELPQLKFISTVAHANLVALNLIDSLEQSLFSGMLAFDTKGLNPDDFDGEVRGTNLSYCQGGKEYFIPELNVFANANKQQRNIKLESPVVDASLSGKFSYAEIVPSFEYIMAKSIPTYLDSAILPTQSDSLLFSVILKNITPYVDLIEGISVDASPGTSLSGKLSVSKQTFRVDFLSDSIAYQGLFAKQLSIGLNAENDVVKLEALSSELRLADSLALENLTILSKAYYDNFQLGIDWNNATYGNTGSIEAVGAITNKNRFDLDILPSEIYFGDDHWELSNSSHITIQKNYIRVANLELYNNNQHFIANGTVSESEFDVLEVDIKDFNLSNFNPLISSSAYRLGGNLSGHAKLANLFTNPIIDLNASIYKCTVNDEVVGIVNGKSNWNNETRTATINFDILNQQVKNININGTYQPFKDKESLALTTTVKQFDLSTLNILANEAISNISGTADGVINISGEPAKPVLNGKLKLNESKVRVNYLNTTYTLNNEITIAPDYFGINYEPILDEKGSKANVVGTVFHENFTDWNFDVYLEPENFTCLNTQSGDNSMYYGKANLSGTIDVYGYASNLEITINAKTEKNTQLAIPLGNSGIAGEQDFVTFIDRSAKDTLVEEEVNLDGIKLDLNLEVTPDAQVKLIFDEQLGDVMKGRGEGNIKMEINTLGNFNMYGRYTITEGEYQFTLQKVINKKFEVRPGGTIRWYGSPYGADINLTAVYKTRAPLYDVLAEKLESYKNRVPVECEMKMTGDLMSPDIDFDINLPGLNDALASQIKSQISTEEEMNRQVFALLVLNRFLPTANSGDGVRGTSTGTGLGNTATSDLITNQISSWLSQISQDFDVGFVYRMGDRISNEELAVALSTQLFNERLSVSGNFGVSNGNQINQNPNSLIGDVSIEYSLTKDGRLKLKAFNESNDYDLLNANQAANRQGVGVFYQENFDNFGEWIKAMFKGYKYKVKGKEE